MRVAVEDPGEHLPLALVVVQVDRFAGDVLPLGLGLGPVGVLRLLGRRILVQRDVASEPGLADFGVGVLGSRGLATGSSRCVSRRDGAGRALRLGDRCRVRRRLEVGSRPAPGLRATVAQMWLATPVMVGSAGGFWASASWAAAT